MGRDLHPDAQRFLDRDTPDSASIEDLRKRTNRINTADGDPSIEIASVKDRTVPGSDGDVPIRCYRPAGEDSRPLILYFHGGAWITGNLETADAACRLLADRTGYVVVSVDYRLAPEYRFPAWFEDCYAAFEWVAENTGELGGDPDRIALAGPSAGGSIAAAVALAAKHRDGPEAAYQALFYPVTGDPYDTDSYEKYADGFGLSTQNEQWVWNNLLTHRADEANIYYRPRLAHDLSGLPPALVLTAGFDPVRDDGKLYADRLADAGVLVSHTEYEDMIHGFLARVVEPYRFERAFDGYDEIATEMQAALN